MSALNWLDAVLISILVRQIESFHLCCATESNYSVMRMSSGRPNRQMTSDTDCVFFSVCLYQIRSILLYSYIQIVYPFKCTYSVYNYSLKQHDISWGS